jgi:1,4-alpha-glucan branching enzyme
MTARSLAALHARDSETGGFEWLSHEEHELSVLAFLRHGHTPRERMIAVFNFTPVVRYGYRLGVPADGAWYECFNSDSDHYGGSNLGNHGARLCADAIAAHGRSHSLLLDLPPLAALYLHWTD